MKNAILDTLLPGFEERLAESGLSPLRATAVESLQLNLGRICNQSCLHCHVGGGPDQSEMMSRAVMERVLEVVAEGDIRSVDITGGAPEMHPDYRWLVEELCSLGASVKTRTNLTVLTREGFEDLPDFFANHSLEVIASLPCYLDANVDKARGGGVFSRSIEALKRLNQAGYGEGGLELRLVFNPAGAALPPAQEALERDYRRELKERYGVSFTSLYTITNMPIGRFGEQLEKSGELATYMALLEGAFNPVAAERVMCRTMLSVGPDGSLYDCDFNQALGLRCGPGVAQHVDNIDLSVLRERRIVTGTHCFGCTAGAGSSCGGAVV